MLGYLPTIIWSLIFVFLTGAICFQTLRRNRNNAISLLPVIEEQAENVKALVPKYATLASHFEKLLESDYKSKQALLNMDKQVFALSMPENDKTTWLQFRNLTQNYQSYRGQFHNLLKHQPTKMVAILFQMKPLP